MIRVRYSRTSLKQLKKLPKAKQLEVLKKIEKLKNYPLSGKKLKGPLNKFRSLRSWPYRIIYQYQNSEEVIKINVIQYRQSSYK